MRFLWVVSVAALCLSFAVPGAAETAAERDAEARLRAFANNKLFSHKLEDIRAAINGGADIDAIGPLGLTPLQWAAGTGTLDAVELLVSKGARASRGRKRPAPSSRKTKRRSPA